MHLFAFGFCLEICLEIVLDLDGNLLYESMMTLVA